VRVEQDADVTDWSVSAAGAAGAMYARFEDLGVWGASMFGNVLLSKRLAARRLAAGPVWYGLGIWKVGPWYGHFGDIAGWASFIGHDPDRGTTVAVVVNTCNLSEALASVAVRIAKRDQ
jgi:D-alanyl-D-alanine carboxypeptidase